MPAPLRQICSIVFCRLKFTPETATKYLIKNELNYKNMYMTEKAYVFEHKPLAEFKPNTFCNLNPEPGIIYNYGTIKY